MQGSQGSLNSTCECSKPCNDGAHAVSDSTGKNYSNTTQSVALISLDHFCSVIDVDRLLSRVCGLVGGVLGTQSLPVYAYQVTTCI